MHLVQQEELHYKTRNQSRNKITNGELLSNPNLNKRRVMILEQSKQRLD